MNEKKVKAFTTRILQECEKEGLTMAEVSILPQYLRNAIAEENEKVRESTLFKVIEEPKLVLDRKVLARYFADRYSGASTKELVDELRTRDGVEAHAVGPNASMTVKAEGPAIILSVID